MRRSFIAAVLSVAALSLPARATPVTHDACTDLGPVTVSTFVSIPSFAPLPSVLENLGFDGLGGLWVANSTTSTIQKFNADGQPLALIPLASPGALTAGSDGKMYANIGDAIAGSLQKSGAAGVWRFDPAGTAAAPWADKVADMANGGIFDGAGNYYISNDVGDGLIKLDAAGVVDQEWKSSVHVWGTNGLVVRGDVLYAAITFDQRSSIVAIDLAPPHAQRTIQTTAGVVTLQPAIYSNPNTAAPLAGLKGYDDMTLGPDGKLWVAANGMGEILRVDPDSGDTCLVASGLQNPSSIRFERGFTNKHDAYISTFSGSVLRLHADAL